MKQLIYTKPMSVNQAWLGRRFKSALYKKYELIILSKLKDGNIQNGVPLCLTITFGLSNALSDLDNPLKPTLDILQKKYGFDDKYIFEIHLYKKKVEIGQEYINFEIKEMK